MMQRTPGRRLKRADLQGRKAEVLARGSCYAADIVRYEVDGEQVVVKDFANKPAFWRNTVGRLLTWREAVVLEELEGMDGVPQYRGRPDRWSVAMTYVRGRPAICAYGDMPKETRQAFLAALAAQVEEMHSRGVVHLDLRHRSNLLVADDGRPVVTDFASGLSLNRRRFGGRVLFGLLSEADRGAVLKWKRRLCPDLLTDEERRRLRLTTRIAAWLLPRRLLSALLHTASGSAAKD
jgi:tRNA A-37 threonylcarbamoyl transferase component Bud32